MPPFSTFDVGNCGCPEGIPCEPCTIPAHDLTLTWTDTGAGGTVTLTFNSATLVWAVAGVPRGAGRLNMSVQCVAGPHTQLSILRQDLDPEFLTWETTYFTTVLLGLGTCTPFHLTYTLTGAADPTLWADGFRSFTLTDPTMRAVSHDESAALCAYLKAHPCEGC